MYEYAFYFNTSPNADKINYKILYLIISNREMGGQGKAKKKSKESSSRGKNQLEDKN